MPTRRCRTRTTTASAITESTSPWTMVEPVRCGGQPRTNGWGSSTSRACGWKLSMADSPANRSTTTAVSTSSWPVGKRSARPSRQRQGTAHCRSAPSPRRRTGFYFQRVPSPPTIAPELLPGLRLVAAPGPTPGSQVVVVETGGRPVVIGGDVAVRVGELDEPRTEGQLRVRALEPELVWLAHEHEPWRPRTT